MDYNHVGLVWSRARSRWEIYCDRKDCAEGCRPDNDVPSRFWLPIPSPLLRRTQAATMKAARAQGWTLSQRRAGDGHTYYRATCPDCNGFVGWMDDWKENIIYETDHLKLTHTRAGCQPQKTATGHT